MIYYSKSEAGFFSDDIHRVIPEDAVPITADEHRRLLQEQSTGAQIVADAQGCPIAVTPPPPTAEKLLDVMRSRRDALLAESDWTQLLDSPLNPEARAAWATYRQQLRDMPSCCPDPANPVWPDPPQT